MHMTFQKQNPRRVREYGSMRYQNLKPPSSLQKESFQPPTNPTSSSPTCFLFLAVVTAAMAKLVFLLVMVAAAVTMIEAADHDDKGISFSVKILLHNIAQGDVTLKLLANAEPLQNYIAADMNTVPVVAQTGQWTAIGPFTTKSAVVHLSVTVSNSMRVPVKKTLGINLLKYFRYSDLTAGGSSLVLTALESWRLKSGKYLVIKLGLHEVVLAFKM